MPKSTCLYWMMRRRRSKIRMKIKNEEVEAEIAKEMVLSQNMLFLRG